MSKRGDLHVNQYLSNVAVGYKNDQLIASEAFSVVEVDKETDYYPVFGK